MSSLEKEKKNSSKIKIFKLYMEIKRNRVDNKP